MSLWGFREYLPVTQRRANAAKEVEKLKKQGRVVSPVVIEGRKIARSFWGKAWCDNLERDSDFASRLPPRAHLCQQRLRDRLAAHARKGRGAGQRERVQLVPAIGRIVPLSEAI
jgi:hypothetical protein